MDELAVVCRWWSLVVILEFEWCGQIDAPIQPTCERCLSISNPMSCVRRVLMLQSNRLMLSSVELFDSVAC
jgi:hypothetical protein